MRWYAALLFLLAAASAAVVLTPDIPVAVHNPPLALATAMLAAAVGLALLQLGLQRFSVLGHRLDLFCGLAFGTLALANLVVRVLQPIAGVEPVGVETTLAMLLLSRVIAVAMFLVGLDQASAVVASGARARMALRLSAAVAASIALGWGAILRASERLPAAVDGRARRLLEAGVPVIDVLAGQEPWLPFLSGLIALAMLVASLGYLVVARRVDDPHVATLALALLLLFFSQGHALLFPPVDTNYVGTGDAFRFAAYLVLLFGLVARLGGEIAESAARAERLRLSRELHDGLAQQLSLLHLCLARAAAADRPTEQRASDLEAARRLVEGALLEARQEIVTLRSGSVSWAEFTRTVENLADQFALNHEVEVEAFADRDGPALATELQADLLRIVHEAFSNAVRHGAATRIEVALCVRPGELEMRVRDDGRGFDPGRAGQRVGVGLRSFHERLERRGGALALDVAPGGGTMLRIRLPLASVRE